MGHQPFEEWIFTGEPLSLEENQAFKEHMSACESCQLLFKAQIEIEGLLQGVAHAKPKSGFVSRWQTRLVKIYIKNKPVNIDANPGYSWC